MTHIKSSYVNLTSQNVMWAHKKLFQFANQYARSIFLIVAVLVMPAILFIAGKGLDLTPAVECILLYIIYYYEKIYYHSLSCIHHLSLVQNLLICICFFSSPVWITFFPIYLLAWP